MNRPITRTRPATAFIYSRVSSRRQVDGTSLDRQQRETEEFCRRRGWEVLKVWVEPGESAKSADRPVLQAMFQAAKQLRGKLGYVVVHSTTRFARSTRDHHELRGILSDLGIALRSVTEPFDETPAGRFSESVLAGYSEFDNSVRSERSADGMYDRAVEGCWVWKAPLGMVNVSRSQGGPSLAHDPSRAPAVRVAFEMYATGEHSKADVLRHVTALGLRRLNGSPLTPQSLSKLLAKPVYAGRIVSPGWKLDRKGDFEAIVSEETFARVQALLHGTLPDERRHALNNPQFPLRRFVRCAWCAVPLTGSNSKGRSRAYSYYRCRNAACIGDGTRVGVGNIPGGSLESKFLDLLRGLAPTGGLDTLFGEIVRDVWKRRRADETTKRRKLQGRVDELAVKERQLTEAFVTKGAIDKTAYDDLLSQYRLESAAARLELERFDSDDLDLDRAVDMGQRLLKDAAHLWSDLDPDRKARLQRFLFPDGITFDGERFGTAPTCGIFGLAGPTRAEKGPPTPALAGVGGGMVTPRGFEPLSQG